MGAVIALARSVGLALARRGPGRLAGRALGLLPAVGAGIGGVALGESLFGDEEVPKRRRRRKALTDNDIRQALIIASSISKKAAENFVLMRVRGQ